MPSSAPGGAVPGGAAFSGTAPRYAVIGQPIRHSLSPSLFRWLFAELGLPGSYEAREVAPEALPAFIDEMRRGAYDGVSVTLPHKEAVLARLGSDAVDPLARSIGAVNTLVREPSGPVRGHNTDALGLVRALAHAGAALPQARVLVLGAGGAARAAVFAARREGASSIVIANRTRGRAEALAREAASATVAAVELDGPAFKAALAEASVLIQSTTVGMGAPETSPLRPGGLRAGLTVLDMVYRPLETALLRQARAANARGVDGLWMLVFQALEQLRLWTGRQVGDDVAAGLHRHLSTEAT